MVAGLFHSKYNFNIAAVPTIDRVQKSAVFLKLEAYT